MGHDVTSETEVPAGTGTVWRQLVDWPSAHRWMGGGVTAVSGPVDPEVGDAVTFTARGREQRASVTAVEPGRVLELTSRQGPVTAVYRYTVTSTGAARCRLRLTIDCAVRGPLRLVRPLVASALRRADEGQPHRLAALVTSS